MTDREIFECALQIADNRQRADYLRDTCGTNPDLAQRVQNLLAAHEAAGSFLESPAGIDKRAGGVELALAPTAAGVGSAVGDYIAGKYKLLQMIGEGGMGVVYMADQRQPMIRRVALKIIKPGMQSAEILARFEAERQALAVMDHPHIARVFDAGTTEAGLPFFVMELVHGIPITRYCDEAQLTLRERLSLFVPVCQAVQHAHQKGVIHRDLKPSNVLVAQYDGKPVPKIIDFGVAKAVGQNLTDRTLFTQFGSVVGTLEYMSPEQAMLNALDVDTRSDIYSLGVLLYELLTGETPMDRQMLKTAAFDEVLRIIRYEEPLKPSTRLSSSARLPAIAAERRIDPRRLTSLVRGELDWIVMRALEKERNRRYDTAKDLAEDIERYLACQPIAAGPPSAWYRMRKFTRRNRLTVAAASAVALALIAGIVVSGYFAVQANHRADDARQSAQEAVRSAEIAEAEKQRADAQAKDAASEREAAQDSLCSSLYDQARFVLASAQTGRRWETLDLLQKAEVLRARNHLDRPLPASDAARLPTQAQLRTQAVAALLVPDSHLVRETELSTMTMASSLTPDGRLAAGVWVKLDMQQLQKGNSENSSAGIRVVDVTSGLEVGQRVWKNLTNDAPDDFSPYSLALSPDGKLLAAVVPKVMNKQVTGWQIKFWKLPDFELQPRVLEWSLDPETPPLNPVTATMAAQALFSPDGRRLVGVLRNGHCVIWNLQTGESKVLNQGDPKRLTSASTVFMQGTMSSFPVAFSPDGRRLSLQTGENKLSVWNLETDELPTEIELPFPCRGKPAFSPGEPLLAVACNALASSKEIKETIVLWDLAQNQENTHFEIDRSSPIAPTLVAFDPTGKRLAVAADQKISIYNVKIVERDSQQIVVANHPLGLKEIQWEPDGRHLVCIAIDGALMLWEMSPALPRSSIPIDGGEFAQFAFSPDGKWLAVSPVSDKPARLIHRATGKIERELQLSGTVMFRSDSQQLAAGHTLGLPSLTNILNQGASYKQLLDRRSFQIGVEEVGTGREVVGKTLSGLFRSMAFNADGQLLTVAGDLKDSILTVENINSDKIVWKMPENPGTGSPYLSADGKLVAVASGDITKSQRLSVWELSSNKNVAQLDQLGFMQLVQFSPDNRWLATSSMNTAALAAFGMMPSGPAGATKSTAKTGAETSFNLTVWSLPAGDKQFMAQFPEISTGMAFSPDGKSLAISLKSGILQLWSTERGEQLFEVNLNAKQIQNLSFTPDGQSLAWIGAANAEIELFDLTTLRQQLAEVGLDW